MFERYGVVLRRSRQTEIQEWAPIEFEGVDADASLERAIQSLQPERGKRLISGLQQGGDSEGQSSRSEADFAAVSTRIEAGLIDPEVAAIWMHSPLGQRRKVQRRPDYVARTIANAHAAVEVGKLGSVTSARPTNIMPAHRSDSLVGQAIKTGQLAVEVDLLSAVNFEARLVVRLKEAEDQVVRDEVPDPGTMQSLVADLQKGPRLISAAPGIGKTHQVVQLAEEHDMVVNRPVLHAVPSHKSVANVERQSFWDHWQGHSSGEDGDEPCPASMLGNKGYRPGRDCTCGSSSAVCTCAVVAIGGSEAQTPSSSMTRKILGVDPPTSEPAAAAVQRKLCGPATPKHKHGLPPRPRKHWVPVALPPLGWRSWNLGQWGRWPEGRSLELCI